MEVKNVYLTICKICIIWLDGIHWRTSNFYFCSLWKHGKLDRWKFVVSLFWMNKGLSVGFAIHAQFFMTLAKFVLGIWCLLSISIYLRGYLMPQWENVKGLNSWTYNHFLKASGQGMQQHAVQNFFQKDILYPPKLF